jgi:hypothetical protein
MHQHRHHYYTGSAAPFAPPAHGHHVPEGCCRSCGQPSSQCGCGCRVCRKESRELLVKPGETRDAAVAQTNFTSLGRMFAENPATKATTVETTAAFAGAPASLGSGTAFVGGGCCVHISVEYALITPTAAGAVLVIVADSEGTFLAWEKFEKAGTHYQVKEGIITTKPGATILVIVNNMIARVRWCEVFSC